MNSRQMLLFRHVLRTTGCLAAAFRAAGAQPQAAKGRGRASGTQARSSGPRPPADQSAMDVADCDLERAVAALESEAVRRALSGVSLPVYHQGRQCGSTVKHSDQLLMFLLKTLKPERYAGGKEPQPPALRPVVLDIDLSAAGEEPGDTDEDAPATDAAGAGWS